MRGKLSTITDIGFFLWNRHFLTTQQPTHRLQHWRNGQHNDDNITKQHARTQHSTDTSHHTKHILLSSTDTGPLHSKWHEACTGTLGQFFLHDANICGRQGMGHGPRTLALRASQSRVYRESKLNEWSLSLLLRTERESRQETENRKR